MGNVDAAGWQKHENLQALSIPALIGFSCLFIKPINNSAACMKQLFIFLQCINK